MEAAAKVLVLMEKILMPFSTVLDDSLGHSRNQGKACSWMTLRAAIQWESVLWSFFFCFIHFSSLMALLETFETYHKKSGPDFCSSLAFICTFFGVFLFLLFGNWMNLFQTVFYIGAVAAVGSILFCVLEKLFNETVHAAVNSALNSLRNNETLIQIQVTVLVTFLMGVTMFLSPSRRRAFQTSDPELKSRQMEEEREKMARRLDRIQNAGIVVSVGMLVTAALWTSGLLFWILHSYCSDYIHFVGVFVLGAGSTFLGIWLRSFPELGFIPFVVGNLCLLLSTFFLKGGEEQVNLMFDRTREASVAGAAIGFVLTQFTVFWWDSFVVASVFCVLHISCLCWYCLSYIPYGRFAVRKCLIEEH